MGHYGKHIIDPETGLCEICDRNAIQEVRQGKRLDQQGAYPYNTASPNGQESYVYENNGDRIGSYVRKSANPVALPPPPMRPRRVIYEGTNEDPGMTRRIIRHGSTPTQEVIYRPSPRPPVVYVDQENQMLPQYSTPQPRPVRVIHQYAQTPPPPASEIWHAGPRRLANSSVAMVQRQPAVGHEEVFYQQTPRNPGGHYVKVAPHVVRRSSFNTTTTRVPRVYQIEGNRKQVKLEPLERRVYQQPEPTVIRRVYKKLPPGRYQPVIKTMRVPTPPPAPAPAPAPPPQQPLVYHIRLGDN